MMGANTNINSNFTGQRSYTRTIREGNKLIGESSGVENRGAELINARLRELVRQLTRLGAPRGSIDTRHVRPGLGAGNSNVGFECY